MGPQMEGMETLMGQWGHTPYPIIPVYPSMYPYGGYQGPHIGCHPRPSGRAQKGCQIEGTRYGSIAGLFLHHLRNPEML